jgi:hypothetical protein
MIMLLLPITYSEQTRNNVLQHPQGEDKARQMACIGLFTVDVLLEVLNNSFPYFVLFDLPLSFYDVYCDG